MPVCFDDMRTLTSYPNRITLVNIVAHAIERDPAIEDATKLAVRRRLEKEFEASVLDLARWDARVCACDFIEAAEYMSSADIVLKLPVYRSARGTLRQERSARNELQTLEFLYSVVGKRPC